MQRHKVLHVLVYFFLKERQKVCLNILIEKNRKFDIQGFSVTTPPWAKGLPSRYEKTQVFSTGYGPSPSLRFDSLEDDSGHY
jgi:hypothetical protein